ncbi:MAG: sigma-70 family RNA polymerase sigma factor [Acidobacteria bacterium]|nr:sigma-70 family RNA polymerase sigma factor [Acidobacteriota bacterium]
MSAMIAGASMDFETAGVAEAEFARLRRRDPEALARLIERYQHRLYRYLLRLAPEAAEDLFQQTWLRVLESIQRYDPRRSFDSWLFAIAHNLAIAMLRRRVPASLDEPGEDRLAAPDPGAFENLLAAERRRAVTEAMAEIPPLYREVLSLRFEEEMKLGEIAGTVGAPLGTVKSRLRRGLEALRGKLQ